MNSQNLFPRLVGIKKRIIRGEKCLELLERKHGKIKTIIRGTDKRFVIFIMENKKQILVNLYNLNMYEDLVDIYKFNINKDAISS